MSACCSDTSCDVSLKSVADGCPRCGKKATSLDTITLKALLTPAALRRGLPKNPRFCATEDCPVVYFDDRVSFTEDDLIVRVHAKHPQADDVFVCYCFEYTPGTIREETAHTGVSSASKEITAEVKQEHCACEVKNPKGTCCLGDVAMVEKEMKRWLDERKQLLAKSI